MDNLTTMVSIAVYLVGAAILLGRVYRHRRLTTRQTTQLLARLQARPEINPPTSAGIVLGSGQSSE